MGHCLIAALCSIHFSIICPFMRFFTTLLSQLFTEASCQNAVSYHVGSMTWEPCALASALLTRTQQAKDHLCPRQGLFIGLSLQGLCLPHVHLHPCSVNISTTFLVKALHHLWWSPQILLPPRAEWSLILRGFSWTGNAHNRNERERIAGFGTAGSAAVTSRAQGDELELPLFFRGRILKPKRSFLN